MTSQTDPIVADISSALAGCARLPDQGPTIVPPLNQALAAAQAWTPPIPPPSSAVPLWDGSTGASILFFNAYAMLPWRNKGGDWTDTNGVAQGLTAFGSHGKISPSATPQTAKIDLSAAVQKGITAFYLRFGGVAVSAGRQSSMPPILTCDGTAILATAWSWLDMATEAVIVSPSHSVGGGKNVAAEFVVPAGTKTAVLTLTYLSIQTEGVSCAVYALAKPKIYAGGTPQLGIAAAYPKDAGIGADSRVLFTEQFDPADWANAFKPDQSGKMQFVGTRYWDALDGWFDPKTTFALDPVLGVMAANGKIPQRDPAHPTTTGLTGCSALHHFLTKDSWPTRGPSGNVIRTEVPVADYIPNFVSSGGTLPYRVGPTCNAFADVPEELYARSYFLPKPGYHCHVCGKKVGGGLAGRGGTVPFDATDSYTHFMQSNSHGNGGSPASPIFLNGNLGGWTYRPWCGTATQSGPQDPGNPLWNLIPFCYYAYDSSGHFQSLLRWGNADIGWVLIKEGDWHCYEHYVKMNTIIGPFDSSGNGVANTDGIVRGYLDGVMVYEDTRVIFRRNPAIKVSEVWLDDYHGGTLGAEQDHPYARAAIVVAKAYIGPMA